MERDWQREAWTARAAYLGADAGASVTPILSYQDAEQILADGRTIDEIVRRPDLSGEYADDLTPESLALDIAGDAAIGDDDLAQELAEAFENGVDVTFNLTVLASARRIQGRIESAQWFEMTADDLMGNVLSAADVAAKIVALLPEMRASVARGVELLDDHAAQVGTISNHWRDDVYWHGLNMDDASMCVLGQLWSRTVGDHLDYFDALDALGLARDDAVAYGFVVPVGDGDSPIVDALADVWREAVGA